MAAAKRKTGAALMRILGSLAAGGAATIPRINTEKQPSSLHEAVPKPAEQRRADANMHGDLLLKL
jgi:hypothetical protein